MDNIKKLKYREFSYRYEIQKRVNNMNNPPHDSKDNKPSVPFFFTDYTGLKGCGCKISREKLNEFLKTTQYDWKEGAQVGSDGSVGIGLDSAILPLKVAPELRMVQSTDFFYPIVDDPFIMGLITVSNVLSDLYATGVCEIDNMLMLLGVARDLVGDIRLEVVSKFMAGFQAGAKFAEVEVRGGQTVECPWMMLGGVGTAIVHSDTLSILNGAIPGDVLVLTKPLGVRAAVNAHQWIHKSPERLKYQNLNESQVRAAYRQACVQMASHNLIAATYLKKFNAHASTDVTGFGIIGHADNLAKAQATHVHFIIDTFPMIPYTDKICKSFPNANGFNMFDGLAAETSGGLLVAFTPDDALGYIEQLKEFGITGHIVGRVKKSDISESSAMLNPDGVNIIMDEGFAPLTERPPAL